MRALSRLILVLGMSLTLGSVYVRPAQAQRDRDQRAEQQRQQERPRANQGRIPPPPPARANHGEAREPQRYPSGHVNDLPHVDHDHWYGHEAPNDGRFRLTQPFEHGRFNEVGPNYRYGVERIDRDRHRFWIAGRGGFEIAAWDWPLVADWCWDCGNDFVVYTDQDHAGWYLLYNIHTGVYVHATFVGM